MASAKKHAWGVLSFLCLLIGALSVDGRTAFAQDPAQIDNVASISFNLGGADFTLQTNVASFSVVVPDATPSQIDFFRFAEGASDGIVTQINGSEFSPSGALNGPFEFIGAPVTTNGMVLDLTGDVTLVPAERFLAGELLFVRVIDTGQNLDDTIIETVAITVAADSGDEVTLRLFESGPDTGQFFAYLPSTRSQTELNDAELTTPGETSLTAQYIDAFDSTEVSVDTALVDPFGRLFNSATGELINGATVTIVDADSGLPADVFGVDGVSEYPSTIVTGSIVTDESGLEYALAEGEFLFPLMRPGFYRLIIEPPDDLRFPSEALPEQFVDLPNAPFEIIGGSFGGVFEVLATGPLNFDVPLDDDGEVTIIKSASTQSAAAGDFVGYTVQIENARPFPVRALIRDNLPRGFRLREDTTRLNGTAVDDPMIASTGDSLLFDLGMIQANQTISLSYVALVSAGAQLGEAVNEAFVVDEAGTRISNRTEAAVFVREDLLRSRLTIIGQVVEGACEPTQEWARDLHDGVGVQGVRLYLETGDYVVTDEDGLYHFENVRPGTHVIQVD
ncbi:MAG: hypothetical protein AAF583_15290, partial [Pseudomonadota bacterium]